MLDERAGAARAVMDTPSHDLRIGPVDPTPLSFRFDERRVTACEGETLAMALCAAGVRTLRASAGRGEPRGLFCAMGVCQECVVIVDGRRRESCLTIVRDGMAVQSIAAAAVTSEPPDE